MQDKKVTKSLGCLIAVIFAIVAMVVLVSYFPSPWEELTYELLPGPPALSDIEQAALSPRDRTYNDYEINGTLYGMMLEADGVKWNYHGPYTMMLLAVKPKLEYEETFVRHLKISVFREGEDDPLVSYGPLKIRLSDNGNGLMVGKLEWRFPDRFSPKDGKRLEIKLEVESDRERDKGDSKNLIYQFAPTFKKGLFQPLITI